MAAVKLADAAPVSAAEQKDVVFYLKESICYEHFARLDDPPLAATGSVFNLLSDPVIALDF